MTITLELSPQAEARLKDLAAQAGTSLDAYVQELVERSAVGFGGGKTLSPAEFRRRLKELSEGLPPLPTLPADFSRADIYLSGRRRT